MTHSCYRNQRYDLGNVGGVELHLRNIETVDVDVLAEGLAKLLPWSEIGIGCESMLHHFTHHDFSLYRFGVYFDGICVGAISVREPWLKGPYVEMLGLLSEAQDRGIGRRLMNWFEQEAPRETRNLWLLCSNFNVSALGFYEAIGFRKICLIESIYAENFDDFLMRKRVKD